MTTQEASGKVGRLVREASASFVRLAALAADAEAVQWDPAQSVKPREDSPVKPKGEISNPTLDTAIDPRRLAVREAYIQATDSLERISREASAAARHLEEALALWAGAPVED